MNYITYSRKNKKAHKEAHESLYNVINSIHRYSNYRDTLRPWDRPIPPIIDKETQHTTHWQSHLPSLLYILLMLLACMALTLFVNVIPMIINRDNIIRKLDHIETHSEINSNIEILTSMWILSHVSEGISLWLVWLTEGFSLKHLNIIISFSIIILFECLWMDVFFYSRNIVLTLVCWVIIVIAILTSQVFMMNKDIAIAALFLLPLLAFGVALVAYFMFLILMHGYKWNKDVS